MEKSKIKIPITFIAVDSFNRPIFKHITKDLYFGSTEHLSHALVVDVTEERRINEFFKKNLDSLEYFGTSFNCEPNGGKLDEAEFVILTDEFKKFKLIVKGLERHSFAPELNKLHFNDGSPAESVKGVVDIRKAIKEVMFNKFLKGDFDVKTEN